MSYYLRYFISFQSNVEEINLFSWHQRLYRSNGVDHLVKVVAAGRGDEHEVGHLVWRERMEGVAGRHEGASYLVTRLKRDAVARILQRQFFQYICRDSSSLWCEEQFSFCGSVKHRPFACHVVLRAERLVCHITIVIDCYKLANHTKCIIINRLT